MKKLSVAMACLILAGCNLQPGYYGQPRSVMDPSYPLRGGGYPAFNPANDYHLPPTHRDTHAVKSARVDVTARPGLTTAARRSVGLGLRRDDVAVSVDGTAMGMRVVTSQGESFATFRQYGIPLTPRAHPDYSAAVRGVAAEMSGCATSGHVWRQTPPNGAYPIYVVHLTCG